MQVSLSLILSKIKTELIKLTCRAVGIPINQLITRALNDEEKYPVVQLLIDDELGPLGSGGTRALTTAIMGSGIGMKGGAYKLLKSIRMWRTNCGDDGTAAFVIILFFFSY